jgi:hypothetical protein
MVHGWDNLYVELISLKPTLITRGRLVLCRIAVIRGKLLLPWLSSVIPILGFLIFGLPLANIAPRSQILRALSIEVWMLEIAVIR